MVDPVQLMLLGSVIAGVTELIARLRARDFWVVGTILTSALIGGLFGAFHYFPGLDVVQGIVYGFGASGAIKVLASVGNKSTPSPSNFTVPQ